MKANQNRIIFLYSRTIEMMANAVKDSILMLSAESSNSKSLVLIR